MKPNLNSRIFKQISKEAGEDTIAAELLNNLLFEEAGHYGKGWYKDQYRKAIRNYASRMVDDEDQ